MRGGFVTVLLDPDSRILTGDNEQNLLEPQRSPFVMNNQKAVASRGCHA